VFEGLRPDIADVIEGLVVRRNVLVCSHADIMTTPCCRCQPPVVMYPAASLVIRADAQRVTIGIRVC
jgi:hypothetical protein